MATARLGSIALDCDAPAALAEFWATMLGGEVAFSSDAFVAVKTDRVWLAAVHVDGYQPPSWPDVHLPKQMHLDLARRRPRPGRSRGDPPRRNAGTGTAST